MGSRRIHKENTMTTLDEIQARADAATEGPWKANDVVDEDTGDLEYSEILHDYKRESGGVWPNQILGTMDYDSADAVFIVHAREDVPRLVAALRAIEASIAYWETLSDGDRHYAGVIRKHIREALG